MTSITHPADQSSPGVLIGGLMGKVLGRPPLSPTEDFFDLGGDSLRAIEVLQQMAEHPGLVARAGSSEMQAALLEAIFEDGSPAALERVLQRGTP